MQWGDRAPPGKSTHSACQREEGRALAAATAPRSPVRTLMMLFKYDVTGAGGVKCHSLRLAVRSCWLYFLGTVPLTLSTHMAPSAPETLGDLRPTNAGLGYRAAELRGAPRWRAFGVRRVFPEERQRRRGARAAEEESSGGGKERGHAATQRAGAQEDRSAALTGARAHQQSSGAGVDGGATGAQGCAEN